MTQNFLAEIGVEWTIEITSDSSAAISIYSKGGGGKNRYIATRGLGAQGAVRNVQIKLKEIDGDAHVSDTGTQQIENERRLELMMLLPLGPPRCRRLLAVLAAHLGAESAEASSAVAERSAR